MIGIVKLALRRPYTFVVMSVLILVLGVVSILTMSTDIFPTIDIPVVTVIWTYSGTSPDDVVAPTEMTLGYAPGQKTLSDVVPLFPEAATTTAPCANA